MNATPVVPLSLEGSAVLHQMVRARSGAQHALALWLRNHPDSAAYSLLGHKGDLLLLHFRKNFTELAMVQDEVRRFGGLDVVNSYLSVVELGLYESTRKIWDELSAKGLAPGSAEWDASLEEMLDRQRKAMATRLWPEIPPARYICFYPMDRLRGEHKNWYTIPFPERQRMMMEHGQVGRKYAGTVKQIISGSVGFDDWEWGVDLFADDPLWFKRLIYEMRFDEVSAVYAKFGPFYNGVRLQPEDLERGLTPIQG